MFCNKIGMAAYYVVRKISDINLTKGCFMGSKSRYSKHLKELGKGIIESASITDTSLASLLQAESDKVYELIKRNASVDLLVNSGKIFSDMLFNIALIQLIPLLKIKPLNSTEAPENEDTDSKDKEENPIEIKSLEVIEKDSEKLIDIEKSDEDED